ncbi:unnamed protein product, partial [Adineta ricciae]
MRSNKMPSVTKHRRCRLKLIIRFMSAVLIPLLLGAFTIVLAIQQDSIAQENRNTDLRIAAKEHEQNLELTIDEQRNQQLVNFINYMSELLLEKNFSLNKQILKSIIRPKTLATLRQLDETRKVYLLRFLHESELLSVNKPTYLSLYTANLSHICLGTSGIQTDMRSTSLAGAYMYKSTITSTSFDYSDFRETDFTGASFFNVIFRNANFDLASLPYSYFDTLSLVKDADFSSANLTGANITDYMIRTAGSISRATLPNGTIGRNANLFKNRNCENIQPNHSIQQSISIHQKRLWLKQIRSMRKLHYELTGWFRNVDKLHMNITEISENG